MECSTFMCLISWNHTRGSKTLAYFTKNYVSSGAEFQKIFRIVPFKGSIGQDFLSLNLKSKTTKPWLALYIKFSVLLRPDGIKNM
jgi:hypothetical protein